MLATMDIAVNKVEQSKLTGFSLDNLPFGPHRGEILCCT